MALEVDEEIRELKKEVLESRGLVIKTNNLANALLADIKSIAKRQHTFERRSNWNGAVAYVLFAALSFIGLKLWSDVGLRDIAEETRALQSRVAEMEKHLDEATTRADQRERAARAAADFYTLVRAQKRREVIDQYVDLSTKSLSPAEAEFFRDTVDRFRLELSVEQYHSGLDLFRTGRYVEAADAFHEAIRLRDDSPHVPQVRFGLARALHRLGRHAEARLLAQAVLDQTTDRDIQDDAAYLVAETAEAQGQYEDARNVLRTLVRRWPQSQYALDARARIPLLNSRLHAGTLPRGV